MSSEKEMGAVRKKAAPLAPLGNFTGICVFFQRRRLTSGAPGEMPEGLMVSGATKPCDAAPGKKAAVAGNNGLTQAIQWRAGTSIAIWQLFSRLN